MKKTKLTRSLMAACSIVALSAVMYGCVHSGDDPVMDPPDLSMQMDDADAAEMAAATAANDAAAAVANVTAIRNLDAVAYLQAQAAAADARAEAGKAAEASDEADDAETEDEADAALAKAEAARDAAQAALADARMYAGVIQAIKDANDEADRIAEQQAEAAAEAAALSAAQTAASDAAGAAKEAAGDAQAELDGQTANADADAASYAALQTAVQAANDAYMAAKAASDSAAAATTSTDAATHQATAEEQRDAARAALANAQTYAGMVADAKAEADRLAAQAAEAERMALAAARTAADTAADAAEVSASSAAAAVMAVDDIADSDPASHDAAVTARNAAMAAATAARDASDAANRATNSTDAAAAQMTAETKQGEAATALADAMMYADMVTQAKADADAEAERMRLAAEAAQLLADTKQEAADAATAAMNAASAAAGAVTDVENSAVLNTNTVAAAAFARAEDARDDAAEAHLDAVAANLAAQALTSAEDQADAEKYRDMAVAAKMAAEAALTSAMTFAEMVSNAQQAVDDAANEAEMLKMAQDGANDAADKARMAADAADAAADEAEMLLGVTHPLAIKARGGADAAETAAQVAVAAAANADAADNSVDAQGHELTAVGAQANAESDMYAAQYYLDEAKTQHAHDAAVAEAQALADAKQAADDLYNDTADGILFHYNAVVSKAGLTAGRATAASDSADRAEAARTDYATAKAQADAAAASNDEAQASLERADLAKAAADQALAAAENAELSVEAIAALAELQAANMALIEEHTGDTGAGMDYMAAKAAAEAAATASNTHVLELFKTANANHITTALDPDANADEDESTLIENRRLAHVSNVNDAIAAEATDALTGETSPNAQVETEATSTWIHTDSGDGDHATTADNGPLGGGRIDVTVTIGTGNDFETMRDADGNPTNFSPEVGLDDVFIHGFEITDEGDANDDNMLGAGEERTRILVFTDKEQNSAYVPTSTVTVVNEPVSAEQVEELGTIQTNRDYNDGDYDHDGDPDTLALEGNFICTNPATCTVRIVNGEVEVISGYRFTGTRVFPPVLEMADADFLIFGVWLQEGPPATTGEPNSYQFGAFADGGNEAPTPADMAGTATYNGSATGVHAINDRIDYFYGDATLNADFGDGAAQGTVTGMIHNIVAGGDALNGYDDNIIHLDLNDADAAAATPSNIATTGSFDGRARLGPGTQRLDREFDYYMEGTWAGQFYNEEVDDPDTAVNETITNPPDAAAGTFGVTRTDNMGTATDTSDDITESFVGAFGTHEQ